MQPNKMPKTLLFAVFLASATPAMAHEGHDHGPPAAAFPTSNHPRAVATSENYEIVAVLKGTELFIYVDRFADNSPVTKAHVTVTIGNTESQSKLMPDGVFKVQSKDLRLPGKHELIFAIQEGPNSDLLITSLEVPATIKVVAPPGPSFQSALSRLNTAIAPVTALQIAAAGGAISSLVLLALFMRRRKRGAALKTVVPGTDTFNTGASETAASKPRSIRAASAAAAAIVLLLVATSPDAIAHGDEDHGDAKQSISVPGDAPRRLPDASVSLPKSSQRLLEVRTVQTKETTTKPSFSFVGRVIANPDHFGVVQSAVGGRVTPLAAGLPKLGQAVTAGEVLGYVAPYIAAIDRSDATQTAGELERQIALAEIRLARAKRLFAVDAGTRTRVEDLEIEIKALENRQATLRESQTKLEPLFAPIDGVIAATKIVVGQVVEPKDILYEIIEPSSLWVEAFDFEQSSPQTFYEASATAQGSASFKLNFIGRSRTLRQQSTVLQFAIENPPTSLNVGTPVTVLVQKGDPVNGIILPRTAVVHTTNGENVVWQHKEPERFVAAPVRVSKFDGERVLVERGLKAGERVVVQGAELINQVR